MNFIRFTSVQVGKLVSVRAQSRELHLTTCTIGPAKNPPHSRGQRRSRQRSRDHSLATLDDSFDGGTRTVFNRNISSGTWIQLSFSLT